VFVHGLFDGIQRLVCFRNGSHETREQRRGQMDRGGSIGAHWLALLERWFTRP
jgi:hypothetical protein